MSRPIRRIITGTPLVAMPSMAADAGVQTGITSVGPTLFLFSIAAALLLALVFRSAANRVVTWITARLGQLRIRRALAGQSAYVQHDFIIPGAYGGLTKINHAVLVPSGILCIERKHCNGVVFGGEEDAQWSSVAGVKRHRFLNPLIRSEGRARALRRIAPGIPVDNLVVFTGSVEFTTPPPKNVIRVDQLESYIARHSFESDEVKDRDAAWLGVRSAILSDEAARKDFDAQISFG
jgi:hypothetical protein